MQVADAIHAIKERIGIVELVRRYVDLKQNGNRFVACCPFHQETKPSFSVSPDKGTFYCFGCHASGDIFEFHGKVNGCDFKESLEQLASEAGIDLQYQGTTGSSGRQKETERSERQAMIHMHELAATHYRNVLASKIGSECRDYLDKRGISSEIRELFGLGYAPDDWQSLYGEISRARLNPDFAVTAGLLGKSATGRIYDRFRHRLIFPIKNLSNQTIAFGGRIIRKLDESKYINSSDTPIYKKKEHLYGLSQARRGISAKGYAILTEGYMDVLTLHQFGYNNGIGVLGTSLTVEQIKRLSGFTSRLLLVFDGDRAGQKAAMRSCEMILTRGMSCNVAILPEKEDIDSLLRTSGVEGFEEIRNKAPDGLSFCLKVLQTYAPREAVEWAKNFLGTMSIPELTMRYASEISQYLRISEAELRKGIRPASSGGNTVLLNMRNMRDEQILIFAVRYPQLLDNLREIGADLVLASPAARQLWDILEQWGPEEAFYHLDEKQKNFWHTHRGPAAPPLTEGETELRCLEQELTTYYAATHKASLSAALAEKRENNDFQTDLEYLKALQETMEKSREQS